MPLQHGGNGCRITEEHMEAIYSYIVE